jgi:hypothetical protein
MSAALARHHTRDYGSTAPDRRPPGVRRLTAVPDQQPPEPSGTGATVIRLLPPSDHATAAPLRLTRRGIGVVAAAVAVVAGAVLLLAAWSAPTSTAPTAPSRVTVRPGDTLWALALRVAPQTDPRAEVDALRRLNKLSDSTVSPGQILRTR